MGGGSSRDVAAKYACKKALKGAANVADSEDRVLQIFKDADSDGSGTISPKELLAYFTSEGVKIRQQDVDAIFKDEGVDRSKGLSLDEFVAWIFSAPNLKRYFEKQAEIVARAQKEATKLREKVEKKMEKVPGAGDCTEMFAEEAVKLQEQTKRKMEKELTPLIKKSFKWHDKDDSGVLDKDESIVFFSNYVSLLVPHMISIGQAVCLLQVDFSEGAHIKGSWTALEVALTKKQAEYKADIDNRHQQAFALLDVKGDGKLHESEVLDALLPGKPQNENFMRALGILLEPDELKKTEAEVELQLDETAMDEMKQELGCLVQ